MIDHLALCNEVLAPWPFAAIAGERPNRPRKPHPDAILSLVDELGVPPERCVLVGDTEIDIATAHAAGVAVVGVSWGQRDADALRAANPDHLVSTPAELTALFA